jgi:UDP-2,4-diacetamido-2,4,6-trideoxy-beta-L-altropyranose hydrolase
MIAARAVCHVDVGPDVGLGHLQRCLALAQALRARGGDVVFLAPALEAVTARIHAAGFDVALDTSAPGRPADWTAVLTAARRHGCAIAVIDSYAIDDEYLAALRTAGLFVVAIDDLAGHPFSAHVVVNGAAAAGTLPYRSATGTTTFLLGPQYVLLNGAFRDVPSRLPAAVVRRVLVTIGGGDPQRILPRVLCAVDAAGRPFTIVIVLGPFAERDQDAAAAARRHDVERVNGPAHLRDVMLSVDLAVSAGGQTLYELAATGTPAVAIQAFDNQRMNLHQLEAEGTLRFAGLVQDADFACRMAGAVTEVIDDIEGRQLMTEAGPRLVDGRGAERVAAAIWGLL